MGDDLRNVFNNPNPRTAIIVGVVLVGFGLVALLRNLDLPWLAWLRFEVLWPALLILAGAVLIWRRHALRAITSRRKLWKSDVFVAAWCGR